MCYNCLLYSIIWKKTLGLILLLEYQKFNSFTLIKVLKLLGDEVLQTPYQELCPWTSFEGFAPQNPYSLAPSALGIKLTLRANHPSSNNTIQTLIIILNTLPVDYNLNNWSILWLTKSLALIKFGIGPRAVNIGINTCHLTQLKIKI